MQFKEEGFHSGSQFKVQPVTMGKSRQQHCIHSQEEETSECWSSAGSLHLYILGSQWREMVSSTVVGLFTSINLISIILKAMPSGPSPSWVQVVLSRPLIPSQWCFRSCLHTTLWMRRIHIIKTLFQRKRVIWQLKRMRKQKTVA